MVEYPIFFDLNNMEHLSERAGICMSSHSDPLEVMGLVAGGGGPESKFLYIPFGFDS